MSINGWYHSFYYVVNDGMRCVAVLACHNLRIRLKPVLESSLQPLAPLESLPFSTRLVPSRAREVEGL